MIAYGIGVPPFIRYIREAHTRVNNPWYADCEKVWVTCERILDHFQDIQARGPPRGYFLDSNKSILVVDPRNVPMAEEFFQGMRVTIMTGSRYLGGFVGDVTAE